MAVYTIPTEVIDLVIKNLGKQMTEQGSTRNECVRALKQMRLVSRRCNENASSLLLARISIPMLELQELQQFARTSATIATCLKSIELRCHVDHAAQESALEEMKKGKADFFNEHPAVDIIRTHYLKDLSAYKS